METERSGSQLYLARKRTSKIMGRRLEEAIEVLYKLNIEAVDKSMTRGNLYDHGYAAGIGEAMRTLRDVQEGKGKKFPDLSIIKRKKKK